MQKHEQEVWRTFSISSKHLMLKKKRFFSQNSVKFYLMVVSRVVFYLYSLVCDQLPQVWAWCTRLLVAVRLHLSYTVQPAWSWKHSRKLSSSFLKKSRRPPMVYLIFASSGRNRHESLIFMLYSAIFSTSSLLFTGCNLHIAPKLSFQQIIISVRR